MCDYAGCVSLRLLLKLRWPTLSAVPERILCKPRQTVGRPATDQNRLCCTLWHERTEEEKTLWSGSTGALRDKQRNVYSALFSNSDPTRFLFLKVFFFCQNILVRIFIVTSETLFNFSFSVELTRKMCETEWKTFTWKTFFGTQCVKNK